MLGFGENIRNQILNLLVYFKIAVAALEPRMYLDVRFSCSWKRQKTQQLIPSVLYSFLFFPLVFPSIPPLSISQERLFVMLSLPTQSTSPRCYSLLGY
jgi:hypothetical protein